MAAPPPVDLAGLLHRSLAPALAEALAAVIAVARASGGSLYLVGGVTRDLLLGPPAPGSLREVDLTATEGEEALLAAWPLPPAWRRLDHPGFGTHHWHHGGLRLDLVRARDERYAAPGALPVVRPAGLAEDLARRDFTVNALAWGLCGPDAGRLVDPWGGEADLGEGIIRVLHPGSFQDDPTRIWRGLRYARRLGFRLAPDTAERIPAALPVLARLSGRRLANELGRVWAEPDPAGLLGDLWKAGVLGAVDQDWPPIALPAVEAARRILGAGGSPDAACAAYLLSWPAASGARCAARLDLAGEARRALDLAGRLLASAETGLERQALLLAVDRRKDLSLTLLRGLLDAGAPLDPSLAGPIARMAAPPLLDGQALLARGMRRGPRLGDLLRSLRAAQLEGRLGDREAALGQVDRLLAAGGDGDG